MYTIRPSLRRGPRRRRAEAATGSKDASTLEGDDRILPKVIGLTGNIACGKSLVLDTLAALGAETVDADVLAREALSPTGPAYRAVLERFGPEIQLPSGEIDRRRLGRIVFADPAALRDLEAFTHPYVAAQVRKRVAAASGPIVVDAVKLLESGLADLCDEVWVVTCPPDEQLRRLIARDGFAEEDALLRIRAQPPQEEKVARADVVIANDGTPEETRRRVMEAHVGARW